MSRLGSVWGREQGQAAPSPRDLEPPCPQGWPQSLVTDQPLAARSWQLLKHSAGPELLPGQRAEPASPPLIQGCEGQGQLQDSHGTSQLCSPAQPAPAPTASPMGAAGEPCPAFSQPMLLPQKSRAGLPRFVPTSLLQGRGNWAPQQLTSTSLQQSPE